VRLQLSFDLGRVGLPRNETRTVAREADSPGAGVKVEAFLVGFDVVQRWPVHIALYYSSMRRIRYSSGSASG